MRTFLLIILSITLSAFTMAQTATNFTVDDCHGDSYTLFDELDAGKVIVICWVMPCSSCTGPAITTSNVVNSFDSTDPNKVIYYMVDDYGTTSCTSLQSWANAYNIEPDLFFSDPAISMLDYESEGMPKVIVLGGSNHTVFYNANYTVDGTEMQTAITSAIGAAGINDKNSTIPKIEIFPNPSKTLANVSFTLKKSANVTIEVFNLQGKKMNFNFEGFMMSGENLVKINTTTFRSGIYVAKVSDNTSSQFINLIVSDK